MAHLPLTIRAIRAKPSPHASKRDRMLQTGHPLFTEPVHKGGWQCRQTGDHTMTTYRTHLAASRAIVRYRLRFPSLETFHLATTIRGERYVVAIYTAQGNFAAWL